jgi:hypothetical protein
MAAGLMTMLNLLCLLVVNKGAILNFDSMVTGGNFKQLLTYDCRM